MTRKPYEGLVYIGSYGTAEQATVRVGRFDGAAGTLTVEQELSSAENASFLALHPSGGQLYAVSETAETDGAVGGSVIAYAVDPASGKLTLINRELTHGAHPCYVSTDAAGQSLYIANYSGGNAVRLPIQEDGSLASNTALVRENAQLGPNAARQEAPHAHAIVPNGSFVYVTDLGTDSIHIYKEENGGLSYLSAGKTPAGAGPRHIVFHTDLPYAYVINELDSTVTIFEADGSNGHLTAIQTISALPADYTGKSDAADIHLSPSGRFLYTSNRGHDSIAVFAVDQQTGLLTAVQHEPCGGQTPRNFAITPDGGQLLVAHQTTGSISLFDIDEESGKITFHGKLLDVQAPVCIRFGKETTESF
ncbi:lactonase family protein [Paenibacillus radicis (ex Gao et al. 2016)]|uniref:6-phosphogluconolactonase n=1 Tax=Paenibacillus radicis (ex Gao et al. 2016) TaxID=1737354 RepID=A0A917H0E8_9BACL|nr:lactonase family protein [Paenibacillus radicis (ex Gao et al. 2016)]GGG62844.1 6-phosphogluconolactonase [Paenibacillus radicis (ex Gao et al. 2016)]